MENLRKTLRSIVKDPRHFFKLSIQGLLVGIFSGLMVCLYRFLLGASESILRDFLPLINSNIFYIIMWFSLLIVLALILAYLVKWEPNSAQ